MTSFSPPEWLVEAVETAVRDFQAYEQVELEVGGYAPQNYMPTHPTEWIVTFNRREYWVPAETHGASLVVEISRWLQEQVFDGQGSETWGKAWPECPGHRHPPDPRVVDGAAVWVCPRDDHVLGPIGRLATGNADQES